MYLEIYPDIIFILNFFIDFVLLFLLKKVNRKTSNIKRLLGASALGAVFAVIVSIYPWMNAAIRFLILNLAASVVMIRVAFGKMKKTDLIKQVVSLYLITYFTGGLMNSIYYYTDFRGKLVKVGKSLIFSNISWKFVVGVMLCLIPAALLILWLQRIIQSGKREIYDVELFLHDISIQTRGLMDTGNSLYDPVFGKPVMVVENKLIRELLPPQAYSELEAAKNCMEGNNTGPVLPEAGGEQALRLRFIPYQSVGKSKGMMPGLILDKVLIHTDSETICNEKVTAAICDNHLSTKDDYHVLLHKELI